jgi:hypothetical protein
LKFGKPCISYPRNAAKGYKLAGVIVGDLALAWTISEGKSPVRYDDDIFVGKCGEDLRQGSPHLLA